MINKAAAEQIKARKITWDGKNARCGHITGSFGWCDGVISWDVWGQGNSIRMATQHDKGIDGAAVKLEAIARKEVEKLISAKAMEIEEKYL